VTARVCRGDVGNGNSSAPQGRLVNDESHTQQRRRTLAATAGCDIAAISNGDNLAYETMLSSGFGVRCLLRQQPAHNVMRV
jgi:hypothetical protein